MQADDKIQFSFNLDDYYEDDFEPLSDISDDDEDHVKVWLPYYCLMR